MICYYGKHYDCYFYSAERGQWLVFDDRIVKKVRNSEDNNTLRRISQGMVLRKILTQSSKHPWSSGKISACHAGDPGSIPGGCIFFSLNFPLCGPQVGASWEQLTERCRSGRYHPSILFYERVETGPSLPTTLTTKSNSQVLFSNLFQHSLHEASSKKYSPLLCIAAFSLLLGLHLPLCPQLATLHLVPTRFLQDLREAICHMSLHRTTSLSMERNRLALLHNLHQLRSQA